MPNDVYKYYDNHLLTLLWPKILVKENIYRPAIGCEDMSVLLKKYKGFMHIGYHGTPIGFIPWALSFASFMTEKGGGDRCATSIFHNAFFKIPGAKSFLKRFNAKPNTTYEEIISLLNDSNNITDFIVFPEGDNVVLTDEYTVAPFRSLKFIKIALETNLPLILWAHVGTGKWQIEVKINRGTILNYISKTMGDFFHPGLFDRWLATGTTGYIPFIGSRLRTVTHSYKLYNLDKNLTVEQNAEIIRQEMQKMVEDLKNAHLL